MQAAAMIENVQASPAAVQSLVAPAKTASGTPSFADLVTQKVNSAAAAMRVPANKINARPNVAAPSSTGPFSSATGGSAVQISQPTPKSATPGALRAKDNLPNDNLKGVPNGTNGNATSDFMSAPLAMNTPTLVPVASSAPVAPALPEALLPDSNSAARNVMSDSNVAPTSEVTVLPIGNGSSADSQTVTGHTQVTALSLPMQIASPAGSSIEILPSPIMGESIAAQGKTVAANDGATESIVAPTTASSLSSPSTATTIPPVTSDVPTPPTAVVESSPTSPPIAATASPSSSPNPASLGKTTVNQDPQVSGKTVFLPNQSADSSDTLKTALKPETKVSPKPVDPRPSVQSSVPPPVKIASDSPIVLTNILHKSAAAMGKTNSETIRWTVPTSTPGATHSEKSSSVLSANTIPTNPAKGSAASGNSTSTVPSVAAPSQQKGKDVESRNIPDGENESSSDSTGALEGKNSNLSGIEVLSQVPRETSANTTDATASSSQNAPSVPVGISAKEDATAKTVLSDTSSKNTSSTTLRDVGAEIPNETPVVNAAQLAGGNGHSEMHIAMQADTLGPVELHARVTGEQVGATIMVEKKEAHAALAVELPSLQQALSDMHLRVEHVVLSQGAPHCMAGDTASSDAGQPQQQRASVPSPYRKDPNEEELNSVATALAESAGIFDTQGRLSVLA